MLWGALLAQWPALALAAPFTSGNLVVYRVGSGSGGLLSSATAVFLDEYSPAGLLVQSIPMPTSVVGDHRRLTASGTANTEGSLQRSADRRYLTLTGYDADVATASVAGTVSAAVNRVLGLVDATGKVDTRTAVTAFSGQNIRSAVSDDGSGAWLCGSNSGVIYIPIGGTGPGTVVSTTSANSRSLDIFGGQLYASSSSGAFRFSTVGTGLPKTAGQTMVQVSGGPATSPYQFVGLDLDAGVPGIDTLYVADDTAVTGGIQKFCLLSGTWVGMGNVPGTLELTSLRGLTGEVAGGSVKLYATNSIRLVSLTDPSGYNGTLSGTLTVVASAAPNTGFRGVDFAPVASAPAAPVLAVAKGVGGTVTVSWPSPSSGWTLQETSSLSGPWQISTGVVDDGQVKRLSVVNPAGRRFFRLVLP